MLGRDYSSEKPTKMIRQQAKYVRKRLRFRKTNKNDNMYKATSKVCWKETTVREQFVLGQHCSLLS